MEVDGEEEDISICDRYSPNYIKDVASRSAGPGGQRRSQSCGALRSRFQANAACYTRASAYAPAVAANPNSTGRSGSIDAMGRVAIPAPDGAPAADRVRAAHPAARNVVRV